MENSELIVRLVEDEETGEQYLSMQQGLFEAVFGAYTALYVEANKKCEVSEDAKGNWRTFMKLYAELERNGMVDPFWEEDAHDA